MRWLLAGVIFLATASGCAQQPLKSSEPVIISGVPPFAEQARRDDCASVALASLLAYYGVAVTPPAIDKVVYDPTLGGTLLLDLENFAAGQGVTTHSGRGNLAQLRELLDQRVPVLLPIDLGWGPWRRPHYVVVFGYSPQRFLMYKKHDKVTKISARELDERWAKAGHLYLYLDHER